MPGGRPRSFNTFTCPNCGALYQVVKVERGPETVDQELTCLSCGGPLSSGEGQSVLKYFLMRNAGRSLSNRTQLPPPFRVQERV